MDGDRPDDATPDADVWAAMLISDDDSKSTSHGRSGWSVLSVLVWIGGVAGTMAGTLWTLDRYFPELLDVRGPDGEPPAILAQPDGTAGWFEEWVASVGSWSTSWPNAVLAPLLAAAVVGLFAGWLRWGIGRVGRAERARRAAEQALQATETELAGQSLRLASLEQDLDNARHNVSELTGRLASLGERSNGEVARADRLFDDLEMRTKEVARLSADLDDALAERDELESQVQRLTAAIDDNRELVSRATDTRDRLAIAEDLVERQGRRIESLEQHLDRVRRRAAEMATELRSANQLRAAWAPAEEVIADLTAQLEDSEHQDAIAFQPESAAEIVRVSTRSAELEQLLNEAVDQLEAMDAQLEHTRLQLRERDAALVRADAHQEALATEVRLLTEEIELAAHRIAELEQGAERRQYTDAVIDELQSALHAERDRARALDRQLRQVSARALRLEERLIGHRASVTEPAIVDLTDAPTPEPAA